MSIRSWLQRDLRRTSKAESRQPDAAKFRPFEYKC